MSGPLPGDGRQGPWDAGLSAGQWQALAHLAERVARLEEAADGPLGQGLADALTTASGTLAEHDLAGLARETLSALEALRAAGVLRALADNAETLAVLRDTRLDRATFAALTQVLNEVRADWRTWHDLARRLRASQEWLSGPGGEALAAAFTRVSGLLDRPDLERLAGELGDVLTALSESGALRALAANLPDLLAGARRLIPQGPAALADLGETLDALRADIASAHRLLEGLRGLEDLWRGPGGEALAGVVVALSRLNREEWVGLARDIAGLLQNWRAAGVFPALESAGGWLADAAQSLPLLVADWAARWNTPEGEAIRASLARLRAALGAPESHPGGGLKGLYALLTDARVQDGLYRASVIVSALRGSPGDLTHPAKDR